jgi:O-antigen/teichoic acid export membrane protein
MIHHQGSEEDPDGQRGGGAPRAGADGQAHSVGGERPGRGGAPESRLSRLAVNTLTSYARFFVAMLVSLLLTPLMLRALGASEYGLWQLVFSVVGFFSLLDLGIGPGVVKHVAGATGSGDYQERNRMVSTYFVAYVGLALLACLLVGAVSLGFNRLFDLPPELRSRALALLWLVALRSVILALPLGLFRGVLFGEQRIVQINIIQGASLLVCGALTWALLARGHGVMAVAWVSLLTMLVEHACYIVLALRLVPSLRISPRLADRRSLRQATSLSAAQVLISISSLILLRTDPLVIQVSLGLAQVGLYGIALKLAENGLGFVKQFVNALSPLFAQLHGQGDERGLRIILLSGTKVATAGAVLIGATTCALGREIIVHWLGAAYEGLSPVLSVLMVAAMLIVPQMVVFNLFTYTGRHELPARAAVVGAVVNVISTLILVRPLGLLGVALGTLVATFSVDVVWVLRAACRTYAVSYRDYFRTALWPTLWPALPLIAVDLGLTRLRPPDSLSLVLAYGTFGGLVYLFLFQRFGLDGPERALLRDRLRKRRAIVALPASAAS